MKRREVKIVNKKKVSRYTAEDCQKLMSTLESKNQAGGVHYGNVKARLAELTK